ncbi:MAG: SIMPL domain-containing protein, partial [Thermoanaerobaculia bacterium]|nr:SIMPL domain-containing protein [Thermoanaerobaculia bacterium]
LAADCEPRPFIRVSGEASVEVEPDQAMVRIGVESEAATARDAQLETNRIANAILVTVEELGIAPEALRTSQLRLLPVYESSQPQRGEPRRPRVVAYRATNTVSVRLGDLSRIGPVVDAAIEAGANRIEGLDLGLEDDTEARRRALVAAVEDAHSKAETIADALGVGLGPILEVGDQGIHVPRLAIQEQAMRGMAADTSTPVATGTIGVSASVMIRFGIDQAGED